MDTTRFPQEAMEALKCYVYRLVDPRNSETFYVGRGKGQRVFAHVSGAIDDSEEHTVDPKFARINEIRARGMEVGHVIHRHGMTEAAAKEVEAALIDAYPGLVNKVAGAGSQDRGTRHAKEIIEEYGAEEFVVDEPLILISITRMWKERGVYEAVRGLWKMNMERAKRHKLVLAHVRGIVRGAYRPTKWMMGTEENLSEGWGVSPKRIGFKGVEAEPEVRARYVGKRVPSEIRKKGAQAPCRYLTPK